MTGHIQHVFEQRLFDQLLAANELVLVKFTAAWCGPCQVIAPVLEKLAAATPNVKVLEVDVDKSQPIARKYSVSSMPTFVSFHKQKETSRFAGANPQALAAAIQSLSALNPAATVSDSPSGASSSSSSSSGPPAALQKYIPKGYELLNSTIVTSSTEILNVLQTATPPSKAAFNLSAPQTVSDDADEPAIISDADSQVLIYAPFANKCKVYSILLQIAPKATTPDGDDAQPPASIKVWANTTGTMAFEDAATGAGALHEAQIGEPDADGWVQVPLRFVRFQSVASLLIFLDGADEDEPTAVRRIALVGSLGDSMQQGKIEKVEQ